MINLRIKASAYKPIAGLLSLVALLLFVDMLTASAPNPGHLWSELDVSGNVYFGTSSSTPFGQVSITNVAGSPAFVIGSSTATTFIVDKNGRAGVGTTSPSAAFAVNGGVFTTASSTMMDGINATRGCFAYNGTCINSSRPVYLQVGARSVAAITASSVCHPVSGSCLATADHTVGMKLPFSASVRNLQVFTTDTQGSGDTCTFSVTYSASCNGTFTKGTPSCAVGNGQNSCSDSTVNASGASSAGTCIALDFTETAGTCTGIDAWSFEVAY